MGEEGKRQTSKGPSTQLYAKDGNQCVVMLMEGDDHHHNTNTISSTSSSSIGSSSETTEDDASSSNESLYNLSDLMAQLPIKRGLSKYYQGRSQSFTCLSRVKSIEDLAKKETPYNRRKMKACKSFQGGLDNYKSFTHPKPIISKKNYKTSHFRRNLLPVQENVVQVAITDRL